MANSNRPSGCTPLRHYFGGLVRANGYAIASGLASNIFTGDLVKSTGTTKQITVCAAGDRTIGVFRGCSYIDSAGNTTFSPYWPASTTVATGTTVEAMVLDDPEILYEIQASAGFAVTDVGTFADMTAGTAGNATTGVSGQQLDSTTFTSTTATGGQFKVIGLSPKADNAYGTNAKVEVLINEHELTAGTTAGEATNAV